MDAPGFEADGVSFEGLTFDDPVRREAFIARNQLSFDVVLAIEVIEHVENQWSYADSFRGSSSLKESC